MKIRYYQRIDGWRWVGFLLAIIGAFILSNANVNTQWMGWAVACCSCSIWIYMGIKDGDSGAASITDGGIKIAQASSIEVLDLSLLILHF